jgi:hypothetical protein
MDRFIIINKSLSAHCCFCYTIVDTSYGREDFGKVEDDYWKETVCECFEENHAKDVCDALNKFYQNT